jgi:nucleoside-diphosphate-sugar epimerase
MMQKELDLHKSEIYISDLDTAINHIIGMDRLDNQNVLVTGATGTIGSFITDILLRYKETHNSGLRVFVAGRSVQRIKQRYGTLKGYIPVPYDLKQEICFDYNIDYIIHAAGNAYPEAFNGNPVGTILDAINSTYHLLEYGMTHQTKRFLYVSSGEVYGQGDINLNEFTEDYSGHLDLQSPRSCYPMAKRSTENLCASYTKQYGLETIVVRPCHTYGPCITPLDNRANVQFFRNVLNDEDIVMKSTGAQMRSYNYAADCASAVLTVMLNGNVGEAYNIANPSARCTIAQLAELIADQTGRKVIFAEPDAVDLANRTPILKQVLSSKKLESLKWEPAFSLEEGIGHTLGIIRGD